MKFDKARVFTALNADMLKAGARVLVGDSLKDLKHKVDDYDEKKELGTVIEVLGEEYGMRFYVRFDKDTRAYSYPFVYVPPTVKRPFKDIDELIAYWDKHYQEKKRPEHSQPLVWVKDIYEDTHILIRGFRKQDNTVDVGGEWYSLQSMFDTYTFEDGSLFGVVIK